MHQQIDKNRQNSAEYLLHLITWQLSAELHHCLVFVVRLQLRLVASQLIIQANISFQFPLTCDFCTTTNT